MIITVAKAFSEVMENLKGHGKIFVAGCAACATKCQTGSEEAVKKVIAELEKEGKTVTGHVILDTPCDIRIVRKDMGRSEAVAASDAILVLACGAGVQAIEQVIAKPLCPGLNPVFIGTTERIGVYREFCSVCGECLLGKTAGICPVTRCAKGLVNGPCGGVVGGKCEVDAGRDCAWALILEKLERLGKSKDIFKTYVPPRNVAKPRQINRARDK